MCEGVRNLDRPRPGVGLCAPMPTWSSNKPTTKKINPELQALANDFQLKGGRMSMPASAFKAWLLKHRTLSAAARKQRAKELIALAARFGRKGAPTFDAVAQLCVLAGDALTPHAAH